MLKFIKGEFKGGNVDDMFITGYGDVTIDDFWRHQLSEECWILEIPEEIRDIAVYNAWDRDIQYISDYHGDYDDEECDNEYDVFWNSNEAYVFKNFEDAMNFIYGYKGTYEMLVKQLYDSAIESKIDDEAMILYKNTERMSDEVDYCFLDELKRFIDFKKLDDIEMMATLKMVILDSYKVRVKEKRLSKLN